MTPEAAEAVLRATGAAHDDAIDVAATALAFAARRRREAGDPRYAEHLAQLAQQVAAATLSTGTPAAQLAVLRQVLVDGHGYHGDRETYDDLRNADLAAVIDRRRGLPVALAILWLHAGRAQGWRLCGLNFPGHFLLQIETAGERLVFDPFNDGRILGTAELHELIRTIGGPEARLEPDHAAPLSNRGTLLRLQNNLKARLLKQGDAAGAAFVLDGMLMLAPAAAVLWREAGLLQVQQENLGAARRYLERAVELAESAAARQRIAAELAAIRARLN